MPVSTRRNFDHKNTQVALIADLYLDAWAAVVVSRNITGDPGYVPKEHSLAHETDFSKQLAKLGKKAVSHIPTVQMRYLDTDMWIKGHKEFQNVVLFAHSPDKIIIRNISYAFPDGQTILLAPTDSPPRGFISQTPKFERTVCDWKMYPDPDGTCAFAASVLGLYPRRVSKVSIARFVYEKARKEALERAEVVAEAMRREAKLPRLKSA